MKLQERVALVTGAAEGLGKAIAVAFADQGAKIVIADVNYDLAQHTTDEIGGGAIAVKVDVTRWDEVINAVEQTLNRFGRIDILVNNAGIVRKYWVKDLPEAVWDEVMAVNLKGTFLCSKAVLPTMIEQQYGRIINMSSIAGKLGQATDSAYCASKFGILGFTQSLALEVAKDNILVNAICPGPILTRLGGDGFRQAAAMRGLGLEQFRQGILQRTPLGRLGTPEQVAKMAVFLVSDDCDYTTGSAFNVSGGIVMH
jgi:NAD(P)-dependent dehydrogenase (short-subunit alcohol dehydrogenase family)